MSRVTEAILQSGTSYATGHQAPMLDLQYGGQMGFAPDLTEWVSNQAYIRRNLICLLVEAPKGFALLPNPDAWTGTLRALVELHAMSIDGLNAGLEVESSQTPVGGAGQQQDDVTNVTETQSKVTFKWNEKYGLPIATFLRAWITNLIMDPNTKYANVLTATGTPPTDMLADFHSATMLFIEPDATFSKVIKSWLVTNMYPTTSGEITGRKDLTAANEVQSYDIAFTGIAQFGIGVDVFAQTLLNGIKITGANPQLREAFVQQITANILATKKSFSNGIDTLAAAAVQQ